MLAVADDGKIFVGCGVGDPFGPECNKGLFTLFLLQYALLHVRCLLALVD